MGLLSFIFGKKEPKHEHKYKIVFQQVCKGLLTTRDIWYTVEGLERTEKVDCVAVIERCEDPNCGHEIAYHDLGYKRFNSSPAYIRAMLNTEGKS